MAPRSEGRGVLDKPSTKITVSRLARSRCRVHDHAAERRQRRADDLADVRPPGANDRRRKPLVLGNTQKVC